MSGIPDDDNFDAWVEQLSTPHRARRAYWHLVLSPASLPAVRRGLEHSDADVRSYCCKVLDHIADEASFGLLIEMLGDEDAVTRRDALHALACDQCKTDICTPSKAELLPLAARLLREDPDKYVRAMAAEVVRRRSTPRRRRRPLDASRRTVDVFGLTVQNPPCADCGTCAPGRGDLVRASAAGG